MIRKAAVVSAVHAVAMGSALLTCAFSVFATERIYTQNGDDKGFSYFPEGRWSTGNKTFEAGDDVMYKVASNLFDYNHFVAVTNAHTTFGTLATTNLDVTLEFADWRTGAGTITFGDLSHWAGMLWFFRPDVVTFSESTTINRMRASGRARLQVPAGEKVVVSNLVGRGMIKSEAGGELELVRTSGDLAGVHFSNGDLTLHGDKNEAAGVDVAAVLARSMIHLDAQNTASLTLEGGKVKVWSDPVGGGKAVQMKASAGKPYQSYIDIPLPAYVADYNGSGKPVVDFGPFKSTNETDFATSGASSLKFQKNGGELRDNASHVFLVFADNDDRCRATPYNDSYNLIFQRAPSDAYVLRNADQTTLSRLGSLAAYGNSPRTGRDAAYNGYPVQTMFQFGGRQLKIVEMDYRRTDNSVPTGEKRIGALGRLDFAQWGGVVIGEIIIFSDDGNLKVSLTDAERKAINDYLRKKWLPAEEQERIALNELHYASSGALKVATGGTARVRHCVATKDNLVKDGPGTWLVGDFSSRTTTVITVRDGGFGFAKRPLVSTAAPAAGARHHFDADAAADSIDYETVDGYKRVLSWSDETPGREAAVPVTDINQKKTNAGEDIVLSKPWIVDNMLNGRRGISLGRGRNLAQIQQGNYTNACALIFETLRLSSDGNGRYGKDGTFREGFAVVRQLDTSLPYAFGSDTISQSMHSMGNDASWAHPDALGASVSWNGVPYDLQEGQNAYIGQFGVLRFACGDAQPVNAIGLDRYAPGSIGGLDICEFITYDRILTDRERIDTEAYLMKKWLNKDHPTAIGTQVAAVNFADGKPAQLVAESDAKVGVVTASAGEVEKSGAGTLTVEDLEAASLEELTVKEGGLVLDDAQLVSNVLAGAALHFDATADSFVAMSGTDYLDGFDNGVEKWADVRGESYGYADHWNVYRKRPALVENAINGLRAVDFGQYCFCNADGKGDRTLCSNITAGAGMKFSKKVTGEYMEGFQIMKIRTEAGSGIPLFGNYDSCHFHPHVTTLYSRSVNSHTNVFVKSAWWVNDEQVDAATATRDGCGLRDDFHLVSFAITGTVKQANYPTVGALAYERGQGCGGWILGEAVYFDKALTPGARAALRQHLIRKWLNGSSTRTVDRLEVASGATLTVTGARPLAVRETAVAGTLVGNLAMQESGVLTATYAGPGSTGVTQTGTFVLPSSGQVVVKMLATPRGGDTLDLVTATAITGSASALTLTLVDANGEPYVKRLGRLSVVDGHILRLEFIARGSILIVR